MKIIKWILIGGVLLVVLAAGLLLASLDGLIKKTVESQGTDQLKVPTLLDGVTLGLFKGTVDLSNFSVGSPKGFSAPQMLSVGGLSIDSGGITNLRKDPIHVASIKIDNPKLVVEQANGKFNFKELLDQLPSNPDQKTPQTTSANATRLIIDDLTLNNAHVLLRPGIPGLSQEIDVPVPSIEMKNIGNADGAQNGAAIKDVVSAVITQMTAKAADSSAVPPEIAALLSGNLDSIRDKLTGVAQQQLGSALTQVQAKIPANVSNLVNQATGKLGFVAPAAGGVTDPAKANNAAQNLLNQGFGALKSATSRPGK